MFWRRWFDRGTILSDEGFSVITGRDAIVYREGKRRMSITAHAGPSSYAVFLDAIARWDDAPEQSVSKEKKQDIAQKVKRALESQGWKTELL